MSKAIKNGVCQIKSAEHCAWCQKMGHERFREQLGATLPCSAGGPWRPGLGDLVSMVATPVARVLGLPCVDRTTGKLKAGSPCGKRRDWLNGER